MEFYIIQLKLKFRLNSTDRTVEAMNVDPMRFSKPHNVPIDVVRSVVAIVAFEVLVFEAFVETGVEVVFVVEIVDV